MPTASPSPISDTVHRGPGLDHPRLRGLLWASEGKETLVYCHLLVPCLAQGYTSNNSGLTLREVRTGLEGGEHCPRPWGSEAGLLHHPHHPPCPSSPLSAWPGCRGPCSDTEEIQFQGEKFRVGGGGGKSEAGCSEDTFKVIHTVQKGNLRPRENP